MDRSTAERLMSLYVRLLDPLNEAASAIGELSDPDEQKRLLRSLALIAGRVSTDLIGPIAQEYPDLYPHTEAAEPLPSLSAEELALVSRLSEKDIRLIDDALVAEADTRWRKVARIVGFAMGKLTRIPGIPDVFYAQRVRQLVEAGRLESQGNLDYMRFGEVRLPSGELKTQVS